MKKLLLVLAVSGTLLLSVLAIRLTLETRSARRDWPLKQLASARELARALPAYQAVHGHYPDRLPDLVEGGVMSREAWERLRFRASPEAQPIEWLYRRPEGFSDIAIVAPVWMYPWSGHSGCRPTARADGMAELIFKQKEVRIPQWTAE